MIKVVKFGGSSLASAEQFQNSLQRLVRLSMQTKSEDM